MKRDLVADMGYTREEHVRKVAFWLMQARGAARWYPGDPLRCAALSAARLDFAIRHLVQVVRCS